MRVVTSTPLPLPAVAGSGASRPWICTPVTNTAFSTSFAEPSEDLRLVSTLFQHKPTTAMPLPPPLLSTGFTPQHILHSTQPTTVPGNVTNVIRRAQDCVCAAPVYRQLVCSSSPQIHLVGELRPRAASLLVGVRSALQLLPSYSNTLSYTSRSVRVNHPLSLVLSIPLDHISPSVPLCLGLP